MQQYRRIIASLFFLGNGYSASPRTLDQFQAALPNHVLRVRLPREIAQEMNPRQVVTNPNLLTPIFFQTGFLDFAYHGHEYRAPLSRRLLGSFQFTFRIIRKEDSYAQKLETADDLEAYLRWWVDRHGSDQKFVFSRENVGTPQSEWIERRFSDFDPQTRSATGKPNEICIYSTLLTPKLFLELAFVMTEWKERSHVKWKSDSDNLRRDILSNLQLNAMVSHAPE